jgi:NAD+ kinase
MKLARVVVISKEGHSEAKQVARDVVKVLLEQGLSVTSFPNLHLKSVEHLSSASDLRKSRFDLVVTVSGDGTILRMLRLLDNSIPCLCVNVGGRGIMAEIKPAQIKTSIERISRGDYVLESRSRISSSFKGHALPAALNEVFLLRQSVTRTPIFTIDFGQESAFSQRMDGVIISTPTGSTGHSYSYRSPFLDGSLDAFLITPVGSLIGFPSVVRKTRPAMRILANSATNLVIDGQEVFAVEPGVYVEIKRHERDAVFIRFDESGSLRQLKNLGFS